jgi:hypothetical protein
VGRRAEWQRANAKGRLWTAVEARDALAVCDRSGETLAAFARRHGIAVYRLYWWRRRLKKTEGIAKAPDARLIPVMVRGEGIEPRRTNGCIAVIEGALRVEVGDASAVSPAWVAALLRYARESGT